MDGEQREGTDVTDGYDTGGRALARTFGCARQLTIMTFAHRNQLGSYERAIESFKTGRIPHTRSRSIAHVNLPHVVNEFSFNGMAYITGTQPKELILALGLYIVLRMLLPEVLAEPSKPSPSSITARYRTKPLWSGDGSTLIWIFQTM
jgi:hypothetical protein